MNSEFMSFELRTGAFSAFIDRLTPTTQIMIVIADPAIGIFPVRNSGGNCRICCDDDEFSSCKETFRKTREMGDIRQNRKVTTKRNSSQRKVLPILNNSRRSARTFRNIYPRIIIVNYLLREANFPTRTNISLKHSTSTPSPSASSIFSPL
jgi:hypothetical protein